MLQLCISFYQLKCDLRDDSERFCDLVAPELTGNKTLSQLQDLKLLKAHFELKKLRVAECYNFGLWKQAKGEMDYTGYP